MLQIISKCQVSSFKFTLKLYIVNIILVHQSAPNEKVNNTEYFITSGVHDAEVAGSYTKNYFTKMAPAATILKLGRNRKIGSLTVSVCCSIYMRSFIKIG